MEMYLTSKKVMHAKEDFRSQSANQTGPLGALSGMIELTRKLGIVYAIFVSFKQYVSVSLKHYHF